MKRLLTILSILMASACASYASKVKIGELYYNLNETNFSASVTYQTYRDQSNYSNITTLSIPASVTYNGESYNVTNIGENAFYSCKSLISVTIPNSIIKIEKNAFTHCSHLNSISFGKNVSSIDECAFYGCGITSLTLPNSVSQIGNSAFRNCISMTSVTIPNNVTKIGEAAFYNCYTLSSFIIEATTPPTIGKDMFEFSNSVHVYVPCGSLNNYKTTNNWSKYADRINYLPYPYSIIAIAEFGKISSDVQNKTICDDENIEITAEPFYGYHFTSWADGNVENPRVISLTMDTIMEAIFLPNLYNVIANNSLYGHIRGEQGDFEYLTELTFEAIPNYGYHFLCWHDNNTQNPRTIVVERDSIISALYKPNMYIISDGSDHSQGFIEGIGTYEYLSNETIKAIPIENYYFIEWSDKITDNPREITVTQDSAFTALFAHTPIIKYLCDFNQGYIKGDTTTRTGIAADSITFEAIPNYGYHFVKWEDNVTTNPRTIYLTKDTTISAVFALDTSGVCGKGYALEWTYNSQLKRLTISGHGSFDEHTECGIEAKNNMTQLIINEGITAIGADAFNNCSSLATIQLPTSLKTIGDRAFYNCLDLTSIFNYRDNPCIISTSTFENVNTFDCSLYVLASSITKYRSETSNWKVFYYIKPIESTVVYDSISNIVTQASENSVVVIWPITDEANNYTLEVSKNGVTLCTLSFNAKGQLLGISFAPSQNINHRSPAANKTNNKCFSYTITGLEHNTQYNVNVIVRDADNTILNEYHSVFETTDQKSDLRSDLSNFINSIQHKILRDGHIFILRGNKVYTIHGQEVK